MIRMDEFGHGDVWVQLLGRVHRAVLDRHPLHIRAQLDLNVELIGRAESYTESNGNAGSAPVETAAVSLLTLPTT
jgi:hypothetical protein